jgi:hypothetical protein
MPINSLESSGLQSVTDSWPRLRQPMDGPAQSCGTHCTRLSLSRQSNRKQKTTTRCRRVWSDLLAVCDERVMLESIYMRSLRIWSVEKNLWETMSTGLHRITVCSLTFQFHLSWKLAWGMRPARFSMTQSKKWCWRPKRFEPSYIMLYPCNPLPASDPSTKIKCIAFLR